MVHHPGTPDRSAGAAIETQIRDSLGEVPALFRVGTGAQICEQLWLQAQAVYVRSPLPPLLREGLFAYLSRFADSPYCMVRHAARLGSELRRSRSGEDGGEEPAAVARLLRTPAPTPTELRSRLEPLERRTEPLADWPVDLESGPGAALLACVAILYLKGGDQERCRAALCRSLGPERLDPLLLLIAFIRTANDWAESHPSPLLERELVGLLAARPQLSEWAARYRSVVQRESGASLGELVTRPGRVEDALIESQARALAVLNTAADAIVTTREDGVIVSVNLATLRLFGYEDWELLGQNVRVLMPDEHAGRHDDYLKRFRETGEPRLMGAARELEARRKDGSVFSVRISLAEVVFDHRRLFTAMIHDLSETRELQEQLLQAQKLEAVGALASGVAHDFNNLLTAIRGSAEILADHLENGTRLARATQRIQTAAERATALTTRILGFGRPKRAHRTAVEVGSAMREVIELFARTLPADVKLELGLDPQELFVCIDPTQLTQVLGNLVVNAGDAMPRGGRLWLSTERAPLRGEQASALGVEPGVYVALRVRDSGNGIAPEARARLFEPFYTTKEPGRGTGLGLATSLTIVRESAGAIDVESDPGRGACFTVWLPEIESPVDAPRASVPAPAAEPSRGECLLLVEDDPSMRELLVEVLSESGYALLVAPDPDAALRLAKDSDSSFDLLITDVLLPGMSGLALAQELRTRQPSLRVLYVSGYAARRFGEGAPLGEEDCLLAKPFGNRVLLAKVRELLDAHRDSARG